MLHSETKTKASGWLAALNESKQVRQGVRAASQRHHEVLDFSLPDNSSPPQQQPQQQFVRLHGGWTKDGPINGGLVRSPETENNSATAATTNHASSVRVLVPSSSINSTTSGSYNNMDAYDNSTVIVATLGPATWSDAALTDLFQAGVNIVRLNFSHRQPGMMEDVIPRIRRLSSSLGINVQILADLQGPKLRTNDLKDGASHVLLRPGMSLELGLAKDKKDLCTQSRLTMKATEEQKALVAALQVGSIVLVEDGKRVLKVTERLSPQLVKMEVVVGGKLKGRQGVSVPDVELSTGGLTAKDIIDAKFVLTLNPPVDIVAVSFVRHASHLKEVLDLAEQLGVACPKLCPKIEAKAALEHLDEILDMSGAVMVARGDLGVEVGVEWVPHWQREIIRRAKQRNPNTMCIVATQMLESMIKQSVPTRAEMCDAANAVFDGADAVMLSAESAIGAHPAQAVRVLRAITSHAKRAIRQGLVPKRPEINVDRRVRVGATLGPASFSLEILNELIDAHVDVLRINLQHHSRFKTVEIFKMVQGCLDARTWSPSLLRPKLMIDLQGPEFQLADIRFKAFDFASINYMPVGTGEELSLALQADEDDLSVPGSLKLIDSSANRALLQNVKAGAELWVEGGRVKLTVIETDANTAATQQTQSASNNNKKNKKNNNKARIPARVVRVVAGGTIKGGAEMLILGGGIREDLGCFTEKDRTDLQYVLDQMKPPPDIVGLAFVQRAPDVSEVRNFAKKHIGHSKGGGLPGMCAKIENEYAVNGQNIDLLLAEADSVMVARGDLAVQVGGPALPLVCKQIIARANERQVEVMVATQLLESMIKSTVPTRAEVSDVHNAVLDGATLLMLGAETAVGGNAAECVRVLRKIADAALVVTPPAPSAINPQSVTPGSVAIIQSVMPPVSRVEGFSL